MDVYGVERFAGKSLGTDLATGKVTLPLLTFLERASGKEHHEMLGWLKKWDNGQFEQVRARLEQHGALAESVRVIGLLLDDSVATLSALPARPSTAALKSLTEFLFQQTAALGV
jgi:octaprenyl-diphosphate synthase